MDDRARMGQAGPMALKKTAPRAAKKAPPRAAKKAPRRSVKSALQAIPSEREIALQIVAAAQETKAEAVLLYDLQNQSPLTDFVLICSGRSQAHVRGICDRIEERMKAQGRRPQTIEGHTEGSWIVMDYDVVFAHIFHPETRVYYDLETLLKPYPHEAFFPPPEAAIGVSADSDAAAASP